jgi:hypothetical protein
VPEGCGASKRQKLAVLPSARRSWCSRAPEIGGAHEHPKVSVFQSARGWRCFRAPEGFGAAERQQVVNTVQQSARQLLELLFPRWAGLWRPRRSARFASFNNFLCWPGGPGSQAERPLPCQLQAPALSELSWGPRQSAHQFCVTVARFCTCRPGPGAQAGMCVKLSHCEPPRFSALPRACQAVTARNGWHCEFLHFQNWARAASAQLQWFGTVCGTHVLLTPGACESGFRTELHDTASAEPAGQPCKFPGLILPLPCPLQVPGTGGLRFPGALESRLRNA